MWGSSRWALSKCAVGPTAQLCSLVRGDRRRAPRSLGLGPFCASHRVRLANEGAQNRAIDRNTLHVQRVYAQKRKKMAGGEPQQCSRCWHDSAVCICPKETSEVAALFPHRIIIYMHVKEFGRGSNTSSLCQVAFPQASKVLVASVPEDEEELARELSAKPQQTFVLYPSADSITVSRSPLLLQASFLMPACPLQSNIDLLLCGLGISSRSSWRSDTGCWIIKGRAQD